MKFPNIEKVRKETLENQYNRIYQGIIERKGYGFSFYNSYMNLQDEVLENLFKEGYEVDYIEALDPSQNDYYIISWSNV